MTLEDIIGDKRLVTIIVNSEGGNLVWVVRVLASVQYIAAISEKYPPKDS